MDRAVDEFDRIGAAYLEHLTEADLRVLVRADQVADSADRVAQTRIRALRSQPALLLDVLDRPHTSEELLRAAADRGAGLLTVVSPFLVFAAAVHRAAIELAHTWYVPDRAAPRVQVPVFDGAELRDYLARPLHRLYLAELLASFARVSSGVAVVHTPNGPRRRRWNDIDLRRLAVLLEAVPEHERPSVWRRLGDLALFLAGVFPDAAARGAFVGLDLTRLAGLTGLTGGPADDPSGRGHDDADLLEWFGRRWYRLAADRAAPALGAADPATIGLLRDCAEHFHHARRVLNVVADRYLFPLDAGWFAAPAGR
jgi:hypothetical protein